MLPPSPGLLRNPTSPTKGEVARTHAGLCMPQPSKAGDSMFASSALKRIDPVVLGVCACILLLLVAGSLYSPNFLSPEYLLQQLNVGSFLGVIASGVMLV